MTIYTPLSRQRREIRTLVLDAGFGDDLIRCSLRVASLDDDPQYEALSYVWGPREPAASIDLDGQQFGITKNLHAALKRLRRPDSQRTLWVDAICINQSDNTEKSVQVFMMDDIYRNTPEALLWLGEEPTAPVPTVSAEQGQQVDELILQTDKYLADLVTALDGWQDTGIGPQEASLWASVQAPLPALEPDTFRITATRPHVWSGAEADMDSIAAALTDPTLANDSIFHAFALFRLLADESKHIHSIPYLALEPSSQQTMFTHARRAAHFLTTLPWWSRIWTVQECILPPNATLLYGPVSMPWHLILTGIRNFCVHRNTCCEGVPGVRDMLNLQVETGTDLWELGLLVQGTIGLSLRELLPRFRHRGATDPRDKVYGLLALVDGLSGEKKIEPDYTKSVVEVYTDTVTHILREDRSLDVLYRLPEMEEHKRLEGLPSWVVDLSQSANPGAALERVKYMLPLYNAGQSIGVPGFQVFGSDGDKGIGRVLALRGVKVDALKRASTIMMGTTESSMLDTLRWWRGVAEEEVGQEDKEWEMKFARTITGDMAMMDPGMVSRPPSFKRTTDASGQAVKAWMDSIMDPSAELVGNQDGVGRVSHAVKMATQMRAFVISKKGRMGLVPNMARMTFPRPDEIFVFPGARTPLILRDVGLRDVPGVGLRNCYTFLGDCYLHGVMDGEAAHEIQEEKQTVYII
ncbi:heterokaryon incompatibility protein-domain-containing protein [Podospora aff. communis PSN243]|uniref:Heterokaryon incompatibility protein-domain-containing protein n=1 Tax=Podospora aff. communis PSN243 TaxID=3040156 RepID=A0AAV9GTB1_9PEZI|nr:heterokaryon incompatibility protein-domain-containing protein [Podospora aff. communis PSN243]